MKHLRFIIKMTKEFIEEIKHKLYHDYSWTSTKIDELDLLIADVIEVTEQQLILSGVSNRRELLNALANELFLLYSVGCSSCEEIPKGSFYLGMSCEECNTPFRIVKNKQ